MSTAALELPVIAASARLSQYHYAIRDIVSEAESLERAGREIIHLNIGDPQAFGFRPPAEVTAAAQDALENCFTGYAHSAGLLEARTTIAAWADALGARTTTEDIIVTSGASEGADLVLTSLLDPGDEILVPAPGYPLYSAIISKLGAVGISYHLQADKGFQPSADEIASLLTSKTKAILLINPNNPTGSVTPDATTAKILEIANSLNLLVISDEVYRDLCFTDAPTSASVLAANLSVPLVTLESLSKTHMLSGWRVGWMRFTNKHRMTDLVAGITKLASGRLCSPTPAQYAIKPALEGTRDYQNNFVSQIKQRRDYAVTRVNSIKGLSCTAPDSAFYLMIKAELSLDTDAEFVLDMLKSTGVLCVPGSGFGSSPDDGYFRMVYLAEEAVLKQAFDAIELFMAGR